MKVFLINLKRRPDRLAEVTKECEKHSIYFELIEAVDGHIAFPEANRRIIQAALGCHASHILALKEALKYDENCLILEDDAVFSDDFKAKVKKVFAELPTSWDIFFLGGSPLLENAFINYKPTLKIANNVLCTHAYIVNKNSIKKLIDFLELRQWKIDVLFTEFQKVNNCFIAYPELAWQREGYSDLVDCITNNLHLRYGNG